MSTDRRNLSWRLAFECLTRTSCEVVRPLVRSFVRCSLSLYFLRRKCDNRSALLLQLSSWLPFAQIRWMDGWILRPEKLGEGGFYFSFLLWQSAAGSVTAFGNDRARSPSPLENAWSKENTKISVTSQMPIIQLQQQQ